MIENVNTLIIEENIRDHPTVRLFLKRYPGARVLHREPGDRSVVDPTFADRRGVRSLRRAIYLKHHTGAFLKQFPNHPWYGDVDSCHYSLILGYNCFCSCRYCFVQTIFDHRIPTVYVNTEDMKEELHSFLSREPTAWISTGEYLDSFQLDDITCHNEQLMDVFEHHPESTLELRTKIDRVDHLPSNPPPGILVSYSINPPEVIRHVEPGTADFPDRLSRARSLRTKGYRIALRIDPIIPVDSFYRGYSELPVLVEEHLGWDHVEQVFLGALRFDDQLLKQMSRTQGGRRLLDAEYVHCPDGNYRPFRTARLDAYRMIIPAIQRFNPDIKIAITMEPDYIRREAFQPV